MITPNAELILAINPGSTSSKVSLFTGDEETLSETIRHTAAELSAFDSVMAQTGFRERVVRELLERHRVDPRSFSAVVARGGLLHPIPSGVYRVGEAMIRDLRSARYGEHASNLGALIADALAREAGCAAFIVDPVVVDELEEVARVSGMPEIERRSIFHALNQKSAAREASARIGRPYESVNLIVAHLGGGVSVGAHRAGRVVDVNNALDGDGPFSPERSGGLPAWQLVELATSGRFDLQELKGRITGRGGLVAYCGTNDLEELCARIDRGDARAALVFDAMAYQIAQEIAKHGATFEGRVDLIVLTGGMAHNKDLVRSVTARVSYLAPVEVIPGEREMVSLAAGARAALRGETPILEY